MKPLTTHEEFCLKNAAHFVAARGRTPATRTREQFATLPEAQAFGTAIGDGRTMIYAVRRFTIAAISAIRLSASSWRILPALTRVQ